MSDGATYPASVTFTPRGIDEVRTQIANLRAELVKLRTQSDSNAKSPLPESTEKLGKEFARLAASIDPVIAKEQKLEAATKTLDAAYAKGLISQQKHNDLLDKARQKYSEAHNPLETLKGKVEGLSNVISKFGGEAGEHFAHLSESILKFGESSGSAISSAIAAFGPFIPIVIALAVALAGVTIAMKGLEEMKEIISEGIATEKIIDKLNSTLKIHGSVSGQSAHEMVEEADKLMFLTGRRKDEILQMDMILSRYNKLSSESYPRAQVAALNWAKITGDLNSTSEKTGIILSGGTRAINAAREAGIVFTKGQMETLNAMVESGKSAEFQAKMLDVLEANLGKTASSVDHLGKGINNIHNLQDKFKESIASDVIPALEHALNAIVKQLGGWDNLGHIVGVVGGIIGRTVANMVYSVETAYHALMVATSSLAIGILSEFKEIAHGILQVPLAIAEGMSKLPVPGAELFAGAASGLRQLQSSTDALFGGMETKSRSFLHSQQEALAETIKFWGEHKKALEGDEETYRKHGDTTQDIASKNHELESALKTVDAALDAARKGYDSLSNAIDAQKQKINDEISDRTRLAHALLAGQAAYESEKAVIEAEKRARGDLATTQKAFESGVQAVNKAVEIATEKFGANSDKAREARTILAQLVATYGSAVTTLRELSDADAASAKALEYHKQKMSEFNDHVKDLKKYLHDVARDTEDFRAKLRASAAELSDAEQFTQFQSQYGSAVADVADKLGLFTSATRAARIESEALHKVEEASRQGVQLDIEAVRTKIAAREDELNAIKKQQALLTLRADVWQPLRDGFQTASGIILDGMAQWIETGKFSAKDIARNLLDFLVKAFEEILQRWITLQVTMAAIERTRLLSNAAIGNASAASGAGVTGLQSGGLTSIGASAGQSSSLGAAFQSWGTYAAYGFLAWVGIKIYEGWTKARTQYGEASIGGGTSGNGRLAREVQSTITTLVQQVTELAQSWHLGLEQLTSGSVTIGRNSSGEIVVKTLIDNVGRVFHSMEEALDYAKVQALKFAQFSSQTDAIVRAAIERSRATTTTGLQEDIDFAQRLATQNLPDIGKQIREWLQTLVDDVHHALDLFGPSGLRSLSDFQQLGPAVNSILQSFTGNMQALYDQLTGHKEDARQQAEQQRLAYNAQRAIVIAQITLLYQQIQAEIAAYQIRVRILQGEITLGGGGSGVPVGHGSGQQGGTTSKGGGVLTRDDRNPTNDAGLAALLQVLDNLSRALQGLPPEIAPGGVHIGGGSGRGARGDSGISSLQSLIDASDRQWSQRGMTDLARQIDDINSKYSDAIKDVGANNNAAAQAEKRRSDAIKAASQLDEEHKNAAIRAANERYNREMSGIHKTQQALDAANIAREHEIQLAKDAAEKSLEERLKSYEEGSKDRSSPQGTLQSILGEGQKVRDDFLRTAQDLGYSSDRIAEGLARIQAAEDAREQALIKSVIGGLSLPIEQTRDQASKLGDAVTFLRDEASKGKISVEKLGDALSQVADQGKLQLLGMASGLLEQMGRFDDADKLKREMDEVNFQIQRVQFNILLDQYESLGLIAGVLKDRLEGLRNDINDPTKWPDFTRSAPTRQSNVSAAQESTIQTQSTAADKFKNAVDKFNSATDALLQSYQSLFTDATLGGSAADRLVTAQQGFKPIEQAALSGDVDARAKFGQQATDYLKVLFDTTGGGELYYSELARIKGEFQTLFAQTRFVLDGVTYDQRFGANITPAPITSPVTGGFTPVTNAGTGTSTLAGGATDTAILQQIAASIIHLEGALTPIANTIANNTGGNRQQIATLISDLERIIPYLKQLVA